MREAHDSEEHESEMVAAEDGQENVLPDTSDQSRLSNEPVNSLQQHLHPELRGTLASGVEHASNPS